MSAGTQTRLSCPPEQIRPPLLEHSTLFTPPGLVRRELAGGCSPTRMGMTSHQVDWLFLEDPGWTPAASSMCPESSLLIPPGILPVCQL